MRPPSSALLPTALVALLLVLSGTLGCGPTGDPQPGPAGALSSESGELGRVETYQDSEDEAHEGDDDRLTVLFLGDSLTAGLGLAEDEAYPAVVGELLEERGLEVRVVNAGLSGDTTAGGLERLDWVLRRRPDVVVLELGPNDGLRGLPLDDTEANLRRLVEGARESGARVLLAGLQIPPNYGPDYARRFQEMYPRIAEEMDVPLIPFLLEGVGGEPDYNLPDGIHPNARGQRMLAENVVPHLVAMLGEEGEEGEGGETTIADEPVDEGVVEAAE